MALNRVLFVAAVVVLAQLFVPYLSGTAKGDRGNPDLTITSDDIIFSKTKPVKGDSVQMNATVRNVGGANATSARVRFYDGSPSGGVTIGSDQILDSVPFNGSAVAYVNWSTAGVTSGTHYIYVVVDPAGAITEDNEDNNTASRSIFVNLAPSAVARASEYANYTWADISFNATDSTDTDGTITTCYWDFDDGNSSKGISVKHQWGNNGVYNVTLLVTDNDGGTDTDTLTVTISNRAPAALAYDQTVSTLDTVTFDSANSTDADGYIASASWTLQNGTVLNGKKVTTTYPQNGAFSVKLKVTDDDGATNSMTFYVTVDNRDPVAKIDSSASHINISESITFDGSRSYDQDGYISNYTWIFPGGVKQYGTKATHQFGNVNGSQLVKLVVVDDDGALASTETTIRVGNVPPVAVAGLDNVVKTYENISFDGSNSYDPDGTIQNYTWNFGDGTLSHNAAEIHYWTDNGTYNVTLLVTDNDGASAVAYLIMTVLNQPPQAFFPDILVRSYQNVSLNGSRCFDPDGYIVNFTWNLGAGKNLYGPDVNAMWTKAGTYEMQLTIRDNDGASSSWFFNVSVSNSPPRAGFGYSPPVPAELETVTFNAGASSDLDGIITGYNWNFGDGNSGSGVTAEHAYVANGTYRVTLIVTDDDGGTDSFVQNITITKYNAPPVPAFVYSPQEPTTTDYVEFDASGSNDPAPGLIRRYEWSWGDGNTSMLSMPRTSHRFIAAGTYNVTLTVMDDLGAKARKSVQITVSPGQNHPPVAVIYPSARSQESGKAVNFDGSASYDTDGTLAGYAWDFGDGGRAGFAIVSHAFILTDGLQRDFTVTLTVTDDQGAASSATVTVTITPAIPPNARPKAILTAAPTTVFTSQLVRFSSAGSYDPDGAIPQDGYSWSFGDGELGSGLEVFHRYLKPGIYVVLLTVKDDRGATGSATETIYVMNIPPLARAGLDIDTVTLDKVWFSGAASSDTDGEVVHYGWDFGDGTQASGALVSHIYQHSGLYTAHLIVTDDSGASNSTALNVTVRNRLPEAALSGANASQFAGDPLMFDGSRSTDSDGRIVQYFWDFGDSRTDNGTLISHIFDLPGTYSVKLTVTDDSGGASEANMTVTIIKKSTPEPTKPANNKGFIPGFEGVLCAAALAVSLIAVARKKRR
jgi:large repetitive protein